jgi:hypothetical protein
VNSTSISLSEHRYFSIVAVVVTVTVLAGFIPLYTLRLLRHDPNLTLLVHAHGFVMTAWIALFLTQTLLIAKHRIELHRQLGMFGVGLATLVILVGMPSLVNAAARRSHDVHSVRFCGCSWRLMVLLWLYLRASWPLRLCFACVATITSD